MKDRGKIKRFLGLRIIQNEDGISVVLKCPFKMCSEGSEWSILELQLT